MSQLVLAQGSNYRKSILGKILGKLEYGPFFLVFSLILFVILITVITLLFSTRQVTKGYMLNKLESKHQQLIKESERKEMQISQVRSLNYIQQSSKVNSMIKPRQVVFVGVESTIAKR